MISNKRLSKKISTNDWKKSMSSLLEVYDCLSPSQRKEIKLLFNKNKNI